MHLMPESLTAAALSLAKEIVSAVYYCYCAAHVGRTVIIMIIASKHWAPYCLPKRSCLCESPNKMHFRFGIHEFGVVSTMSFGNNSYFAFAKSIFKCGEAFKTPIAPIVATTSAGGAAPVRGPMACGIAVLVSSSMRDSTRARTRP